MLILVVGMFVHGHGISMCILVCVYKIKISVELASLGSKCGVICQETRAIAT